MRGEPRLAIVVAADGLTATVAVRPGEPLDQRALEEALAQAGIVVGIDASVVAQIGGRLPSPKFALRARQIAAGRAPVPGASGAFVPAFPMGIAPGRLREDGRLDYHDRGLLKHVDVGARLGRLRPPTGGERGLRVDGREIPATPGSPLHLTLGRGVRAAGDGELFAARGGVVAYNSSALDVEDHHVHGADVDLHSGDVKMGGSLVVQGSIEVTCLASATGDLEILGRVDGGRAEAGGNLRVHGGVHGAADSLLFAKHDLAAHHADVATIRCGATLRLVEAVNSQLGAVRVEISRCFRGGSVVAEESIVVGEVGSPQGTPTLLAVGVAGAGARLVRPTTTERSSERGERVEGSEDDELPLAVRIERLRRRKHLESIAHVDVLGVAHPGVVVRIGEQELVVNEPLRGVRFSLDPDTRQLRYVALRR